MSLTVSTLITNFNSYIGDASTDRISAAERLQYITEATIWLQENLENDVQNATYLLNYMDTVHYYKITNSVADLLEGTDLRRAEKDQFITLAKKSSRELAEEIGLYDTDPSWGIERRDGNSYLIVNMASKYTAKTIEACDSLTSSGTWAVDATNSDATNLTIDNVNFKVGSGAFNFDITVGQSVNNKATLKNTTMVSMDLSDSEDIDSWIFWVYLPTVTNFSSITLYWGSSSSAYWSATVTTDIDSSPFVAGWNRVKVDWSAATKTSTPSSSAITFMQIDYNYTGSQTSDTDYRLDNIILVRPEPITLWYISWNVGTNAGGTDIVAFTATSDIPYFSGQYDQYKYAVAHKAAAICFQNLRLLNEAQLELQEADRVLARAKQIIPSSKNPETKSFKVRGVNFSRRGRGR